MLLSIKLKLIPTPEDYTVLLSTMERFNEACNYIAKIAWDTKVFRRVPVHKLTYYDVRERFELAAQMTVRAIGKVTDTYATMGKKKKLPSFRPHGSVEYDNRILRVKGLSEVSIWTLEGRKIIPFLVGYYQANKLTSFRAKGQAKLILRNGIFYLVLALDVPEPALKNPEGWLGIDLGIVNLATTSDGEVFSGGQVESRRRWYRGRRDVLQAVGTKSAKHRLKKLSGRQHRFQTDTNHCISKAIVEKAARHNFGIALEDLSGITGRVTVRRSQRSRHYNWSFYQLQRFVSYKAKLSGITVQFVDPRYTSQACSVCGHCSRSNRPTRDNFVCSLCGYAAPADENAARNIASRAMSTSLMVSTEVAKANISNCATV